MIEVWILQYTDNGCSVNREDSIDRLKVFATEEALDSYVREEGIVLGFTGDEGGFYGETVTRKMVMLDD